MAEHSPLVSVCIANYNGMEVIDDCLKSILAQTGDLFIEIIVHDDASSDGSADHIRHHYPRARLITSESNVGFCVANNRMVAAATGNYLLLLNNDAALYPDALQTLLAEATRLGQPAILGLPQYEATTGELIDIGSLLDPFLNPVPNLDLTRRDVGMVIGACLWVPKTLWTELGGFPDWFHTLAEDMYLCARARLAGYQVRAIGESGFRHHVGNSLGGGKITTEKRLVTSRRRRVLSERNKSYVMAMIYPAPLFHVIFPIHIALLIVEGLLLSLIGRDWSLFRGIYLGCMSSLWRERNRILCFRRQIQEKKRIRLTAFLSVFSPMPHKLRMFFSYGLPKIH